ncbi:MAG: TMEM43 family protein, partial [Myxococcota bacterium]
LVLTIGTVPILFGTESYVGSSAKLLQEEKSSVVKADAGKISPKNDKKLVHLTANLKGKQFLQDPKFGLELNVLGLKRTVEMYQVREKKETDTKTKEGVKKKTTKYTYERVWSDSLIDSSGFRSRVYRKSNPKRMSIQAHEVQSKHIHLGVYVLSKALKSKLPAYTKLKLTPKVLASLSPNIRRRFRYHHEDALYNTNPKRPYVGAYRVHFSVIRPQQVSVLAQQKNHELSAYTMRSGTVFSMMKPGQMGIPVMIAAYGSDVATTAWFLRVLSLLMCIGGLFLLAKNSTWLGRLPMIRNWAAVGSVSFAVLMGVGLSLGTVGIYNLTALSLLAAAGFLSATAFSFLSLSFLSKRRLAKMVP